MLILSRKTHEQIVVGEHGELRISVVEIRGDKVRIGIDVDRSVPVHRLEVWEKIIAKKEKDLGI